MTRKEHRQYSAAEKASATASLKMIPGLDFGFHCLQVLPDCEWPIWHPIKVCWHGVLTVIAFGYSYKCLTILAFAKMEGAGFRFDRFTFV